MWPWFYFQGDTDEGVSMPTYPVFSRSNTKCVDINVPSFIVHSNLLDILWLTVIILSGNLRNLSFELRQHAM